MLKFVEDLLQGASVEWKTLEEIGVFIRGNGLQKKDFTSNGIGCIHYGQIYTHYDMYAEETISYVSDEAAWKFKKAQRGDLIIAVTSENLRDVCKTVVWGGENEICVSGETYIFKHKQNAKYLAYHLQTPMFYNYKRGHVTGTKVIRIHERELAKFLIPIPPLHIQGKIVAVLDKFTALERELETKLGTEFVLRRKQYEYYRNKLLTFGDEVEWKRLGEVAKIFSGKNKEWSENGIYPIYGSTGIIGHTGHCEYTTEQLLVARVGANAGYVHIANGEYAVSDNTLIVQNSDCLLLKFLYFNLVNRELNKLSKGGAQPLITGGQLKEVLIPLPSLTEQARIVSLLDKFDTLANSLTEGVPREIALRHKQYEYYRDALLTFPKAT